MPDQAIKLHMADLCRHRTAFQEQFATKRAKLQRYGMSERAIAQVENRDWERYRRRHHLTYIPEPDTKN